MPDVRIGREQLAARGPRLIQREILRNHHDPAEAGPLLGDRDIGEVHREAKDLLVEPRPIRRPAAGGLGRNRGRTGREQDRVEIPLIIDHLQHVGHLTNVADLVHCHLGDVEHELAEPIERAFATAHGILQDRVSLHPFLTGASSLRLPEWQTPIMKELLFAFISSNKQ